MGGRAGARGAGITHRAHKPAFPEGRELLGKQTLLRGGNNETIRSSWARLLRASGVFREISLPWGAEKKRSNS